MRSHASLGVALIAALLTVTAVGCGTSPPAPASPTGAPPLPLSSHTPSTTAHVGAGCGFIPVHGAGSFGAMSGQRAATAASGNPQLSVFSSAIRTAALRRELNVMRSFTLFIPVNSAFAELSRIQLKFLHDRAHLVDVVRYQVVPQMVTPTQIARGGSVVTLSGARLALARRGRAYRVNQATVLCGNIKTANGTLYVIDKVLLPPK
jgi:Fasciclin domain